MPTTFKLPTEGQTFRGVGDTNAVYQIKGGQLSNVGQNKSTASTDFYNSDGSVIKSGQALPDNFDTHGAYKAVNPSYSGTLWGNTSPAAQYQGFDQLPEYNVADINTAVGKGYNFAPGQAPLTVNQDMTGMVNPNSTGVSGLISAPAGTAPSNNTPANAQYAAQTANSGGTPPAATGSTGGTTGTGTASTSGSSTPTYPGLISNLVNASNTNPLSSGPAYDNYNTAVQKLATLKSKIAEQFGNMEQGDEALPIVLGREGALQKQYAAQLDAAQLGVNQAQQALGYGIQEQQAQLGGLGTAIGSVQPQLGAIGSQQYYNPLSAGGSQGGGTLPQAAADFVNSLAQQVKSGQMTRADAESRLTSYGVTGLQALNSALGTGFNTNASNASAATTATGQQIQAAIAPATQALDALQTAYSGLSGLQQGNALVTNVPLLSQLAQQASLAFGPGRDAASAYQGALQEARSRIDAALVGSIGVNAAAAQASALLPDNMLPSEIPQKIAAAKQYLQNQLTSYTSSGQQNNSNAQSNNPPGWF